MNSHSTASIGNEEVTLLYSVKKGGKPSVKASPMARPSHVQIQPRSASRPTAPATSIRVPVRNNSNNVLSRQQQSVIAHANRMRSKRHSTGSSVENNRNIPSSRFGGVHSPPSPNRGFQRSRTSHHRTRNTREEAEIDKHSSPGYSKRRYSSSSAGPMTTTDYSKSQNSTLAVVIPGTTVEHDHRSIATKEKTCDYDKSATVLYELLEASSWEDVIQRSRSHSDEARTWIVRKDKSLKVRWKLLPLHASIIFQAPNTVVSALLEVYTLAAKRKDDQGMLPLHLAFRHKQEDEELLQALLTEHPKAVIVKDKRDRVPLDHGRDLKFSSKMMKLYAESYASATVGEGLPNHAGGPASPLHAVSLASLGASLEGEASLKRRHKDDIQRLKSQYEDKLNNMKARMEHETQRCKLSAADERQKLIQSHNEEMAELRELLSRQAGREDTMVQDLQAQIDDLQTALEAANGLNETLEDKYKEMENYSSDLHQQLHRIIQDQLFIRDLANRQSKELEGAREMRQQIIQTLMQQEDTDGHNDQMRSSKLSEVAENVRERVQSLIDRNPCYDLENYSKGLSRIEVERTDDRDRLDENRDVIALDRAVDVQIREDGLQITDVKSIGEDDISAITEHSP